MTGEVAHEKGREGVRRAKQWLDRSTRVAYAWTRIDKVFEDLLTFPWPHGNGKQPFTFDLGGQMRVGRFDKQFFLAEVKNYERELDLSAHFRDFLAKCYVAYLAKRERCDHLMWISWSPFKASAWDRHSTPEAVRAAILHDANRTLVLGTANETEAKSNIDESAVVEVASRLWLITLCKKQEDLVISDNHFAKLMEYMNVTGGD